MASKFMYDKNDTPDKIPEDKLQRLLEERRRLYETADKSRDSRPASS